MWSGFRSEQNHGCEGPGTQLLITLTLSSPVVLFRRQEVCVREWWQCCEAGSAGLVCSAQRYSASFFLLKAAHISSLVSTGLVSSSALSVEVTMITHDFLLVPLHYSYCPVFVCRGQFLLSYQELFSNTALSRSFLNFHFIIYLYLLFNRQTRIFKQFR